jgi:hypothetical protein
LNPGKWFRRFLLAMLLLLPKTAKAVVSESKAITYPPVQFSGASSLLQSGVDISVIALWLGHESPTTTHQYVEADLAMKERALARMQDPETPSHRFRASDSLLEFLKTL